MSKAEAEGILALLGEPQSETARRLRQELAEYSQEHLNHQTLVRLKRFLQPKTKAAG